MKETFTSTQRIGCEELCWAFMHLLFSDFMLHSDPPVDEEKKDQRSKVT